MKKILYLLLFISSTAFSQTIEEVKREIITQGLPHPNIVLAQARLESGNFKSKLTRTHNNILGIRHGKHYARYSHWRECIADYKKRISSRYKGGCYYAFLQRIGYADDKRYISALKKF